MTNAPIKFEMGSGRHDFDAEIFRFNATDGTGRVPCAISNEAFEDITGVRIDSEIADAQFADWEQVIFNIAAAKYERGVRQQNGAVVVAVGDKKLA